MKNKLAKIMGIVLTIAILAGLLMSAVPVSAAKSDLAFDTVTSPVKTNGTITMAGGNVTLIAASPDGKTIFAWDQNLRSCSCQR